MPLPWMTVLQHVPWGDLISNAPKIADGARKLWQRARHESPAPPVEVPAAPIDERVTRLHARVAALEQDTASASELIRALADQQAQLVVALDAVKRRQRRMLWVGSLVGIGLVAGIVWLVMRG